MIEVPRAHPELHTDRVQYLARQFAGEPAYRHSGLRLDEMLH
ncbi:hypothetical protein [Achromobacter sp.]